MSLHGWIILDKPIGITSAHGVAKVKRLMRAEGLKKPKVGHGGTLDPLATGVLPIALGEATKLTGGMLNGDKSYDFTIAFGTATETQDAEGAVTATSAVRPALAQIAAVLPRFTGSIQQRPPAYSALKVDGQRAYKRARAGETVELAVRTVTVHELRVAEGFAPPAPSSPLNADARGDAEARSDADSCTDDKPLGSITLSARVSKGTYIRALAADIAEALGTMGHVAMLRRTVCGPFPLEKAITLDNLERAANSRGLGSVLLSMTAGLDDIPALPVTPEEANRLKHGQGLFGRPEQDGPYIAMDGDTPAALVSLIAGEGRIDRGFNF